MKAQPFDDYFRRAPAGAGVFEARGLRRTLQETAEDGRFVWFYHA